MFYFFNRGPDYIRCEIRPNGANGCYEILVAEPGQPERLEVFNSSDQAREYWHHLQEDLNQRGWWGPHGRE
jgi:hypothetical protein